MSIMRKPETFVSLSLWQSPCLRLYGNAPTCTGITPVRRSGFIMLYIIKRSGKSRVAHLFYCVFRHFKLRKKTLPCKKTHLLSQVRQKNRSVCTLESERSHPTVYRCIWLKAFASYSSGPAQDLHLLPMHNMHKICILLSALSIIHFLGFVKRIFKFLFPFQSIRFCLTIFCFCRNPLLSKFSLGLHWQIAEDILS